MSIAENVLLADLSVWTVTSVSTLSDTLPKNKCIYNNTAGVFQRLSYNHASGLLRLYSVAYSQSSPSSKLELFHEDI